jgi:hypothetical protein
MYAAYLTKSKFTSRFAHLQELVLRYTSLFRSNTQGLRFSDLLSSLTEHQNIRKVTLFLHLMVKIRGGEVSSVQEIADVDLERCRNIDKHLSNRDAFPRLDNFTVFLDYIAGSKGKPSLKGTITNLNYFPKLANSGKLHVLR